MALETAEVVVGTTEVELEAALGSGTRTYVQITNLGPYPVLIGPSGLTPSTGYPIYPRQTFRGNNIANMHNETIMALVGSGQSKIRIMEAT